jgi:hypothetical protein
LWQGAIAPLHPPCLRAPAPSKISASLRRAFRRQKHHRRTQQPPHPERASDSAPRPSSSLARPPLCACPRAPQTPARIPAATASAHRARGVLCRCRLGSRCRQFPLAAWLASCCAGARPQTCCRHCPLAPLSEFERAPLRPPFFALPLSRQRTIQSGAGLRGAGRSRTLAPLKCGRAFGQGLAPCHSARPRRGR